MTTPQDGSNRRIWPAVMSAAEVGEYLRLHPLTVRRHLREGSWPGRKVGGQWRVRKVDLDAMFFMWTPRTEALLREDRRLLEAAWATEEKQA